MTGESFSAYLREIGEHDLLSAEQEIELGRRVQQGDQQAKQEMIERNLRLVPWMAKKFVDADVPLEDLVQEGNIGLMRAVERFDPELGHRFSTYAMFWIRQAIFRTLKRDTTIRIPENHKNALATLSYVQGNLLQMLGREPTDEEVAAESGYEQEYVMYLRQIQMSPTSLDQMIETDEGESSTLLSFVESKEPDVHEHTANQFDIRSLRSCISALPSREGFVLSLRFGLDDAKPHTLNEIAHTMGISRERVRQIEQRGLSRIRDLSTNVS